MLANEARRLLSAEGLRILDGIGPYGSGADVVRLSSSLRREGHPPDLIAAVLTQARLREKAAAKFGPFAARMLLTEAGLEQATRLSVAAIHAGRYRTAGVAHVADLGCGIGGDALALSAIDIPVTAVERDEVTAAFAAYNLAPFESAQVMHSSAEDHDLAGADAAFLDPARREAGHSSTTRLRPDDWSPSLDFAFLLSARLPVGVKLAPGMDRSLIPDDAEAQWVTVDGETVETLLWFGALARQGVRRSALVLAGGRSTELMADADGDDPELAPLGRYVHEPAGAVIRARLIGTVAQRLQAGLLSPDIAYLTGPLPSPDALATSFEVGAVLPLDERTLARELKNREIGVLEIKKRGVDIDPAQLRRKLGLRGRRAATLILTRLEGKRVAILTERVAPAAEGAQE